MFDFLKSYYFKIVSQCSQVLYYIMSKACLTTEPGISKSKQMDVPYGTAFSSFLTGLNQKKNAAGTGDENAVNYETVVVSQKVVCEVSCNKNFSPENE